MYKLTDNSGNIGTWGDFETMKISARAYAIKGVKVKVVRLSVTEEASLRKAEEEEAESLARAESAWLRRAEYDPEAQAEMEREDAMGYSFEEAFARYK